MTLTTAAPPMLKTRRTIEAIGAMTPTTAMAGNSITSRRSMTSPAKRKMSAASRKSRLNVEPSATMTPVPARPPALPWRYP